MDTAHQLDQRASSPWQKLAQKTERLLLIIGLALLAVFLLGVIDGRVSSRLSLWAFAAAQEPTPDQTIDAASAKDGVDFTLWSPKRIQAYKASLLTKVDLPIAVLTIPRLLLTAPILEGTDELTLNRGLGRIASSAELGEDGNVGIAGHRDGFFRVLKDIAQGDSIEITTSQGHDLYVVDRIDIVNPQDVSVIQPGGSAGITLITCYPFYYIGDAPRRYVVHASLTQRWLQLRSRAMPPSNPVTQQKEK